MAGSRDSLAPPGPARPCFLGLQVCGDPTGTLSSASPGRTGARSHSLCALVYRKGRELGQEVESLSDLPGDLTEWEVGTVAFLVPPPKATPRPRTPGLLQSWIPAQLRSLMGAPDFVPSRVPRAVPLCPPLLSLSATCLGPSACPSSSLLLMSTTLSLPPSRGEALPGEGCGLSPAASLASASPLPATAAGHSKSSEESWAGRDRFLYRPAGRAAPAGGGREGPQRVRTWNRPAVTPEAGTWGKGS